MKAYCTVLVLLVLTSITLTSCRSEEFLIETTAVVDSEHFLVFEPVTLKGKSRPSHTVVSKITGNCKVVFTAPMDFLLSNPGKPLYDSKNATIYYPRYTDTEQDMMSYNLKSGQDLLVKIDKKGSNLEDFLNRGLFLPDGRYLYISAEDSNLGTNRMVLYYSSDIPLMINLAGDPFLNSNSLPEFIKLHTTNQVFVKSNASRITSNITSIVLDTNTLLNNKIRLTKNQIGEHSYGYEYSYGYIKNAVIADANSNVYVLVRTVPAKEIFIIKIASIGTIESIHQLYNAPFDIGFIAIDKNGSPTILEYGKDKFFLYHYPSFDSKPEKFSIEAENNPIGFYVTDKQYYVFFQDEVRTYNIGATLIESCDQKRIPAWLW